jgi:hypothetical protein
MIVLFRLCSFTIFFFQLTIFAKVYIRNSQQLDPDSFLGIHFLVAEFVLLNYLGSLIGSQNGVL